MKSLSDFIIIENELIPDEVINELMDEYKSSGDWLNYEKGAKGGKEKATAILISHPKIIGSSTRRKKIHDDITKCLGSAFDRYHEKHSRREKGLNFLNVRQLVGLRLIKYKKGQSLDVHTDKYTDPDTGVQVWPAVTFTYSVNDNFGGGELELFDGECVYKAKSGQCVMFPANFLFPHGVNTVTRGIRYALVGWFV